jgi:ADP-ribosyl-[dinitrogen reductase] hydrolase
MGMNQVTIREDRIRGVLLGQAAGDALGSHYEFGAPSRMNAAMQRGTFGHEPGEWTDDTQTALCIAAAHSDPAMVAINIVGWYSDGPLDVGISTSRLLSMVDAPHKLQGTSRALGEQAAAKPRPAGWDPGMANGSLMRTGPACLPYLGDRDKVASVARTLSDLTHYDPHGWTGDACVIWSLLIEEAVTTGCVSFYAPLDYLPEQRRDFWRGVIREAFSDTETPRRNGSAVAAFRCALRAVAHAESLEDGLQRAVAMGDDTDTVAAIAGALLGAVHGASAVPLEWRQMLHGWSPRSIAEGGTLDADGIEELALEAAG